MTKDWLIRTKSNHILGPVTKDKIKQLISNGSIKGDDEVCSGNGYWVYVREQDLIARFIFSEEGQGYNPVQENDPVLNTDFVHPAENELEYPDMDNDGDQDEFGNLMPDGDDLEYPDMGSPAAVDSQIDVTLVNMNLDNLDQSTEEEKVPDFDISDSVEDQLEELNQEESPKKKTPKKRVKSAATGITKRQASSDIPRKRETQAKARAVSQHKKSSLTKNALYLLIILFFILVSLSMYFRKTLLKGFIESSMNTLIPNTYAQVTPVSKKKNGLMKMNSQQS